MRIYDSRKRIMVTGGAGFLGSHLCDKLLENGHEVLCVDNLFTGTKHNIDHLHNHPRFEFMRHDVTFPLFVEVDEIYNLACPASPIHYQHDPVQTTKTSVHGAINMLGLAKRLKARILQASTSEVYGDPQVHPQTEDYWGHVNPVGMRSCYDEGKRCAETLFFDYHRQHKLEIKVARIFNSLTGDQKVVYFRDGRLHHETFAECHERIKNDVSGVLVPCFDEDGRMVLKPISAIWKHPVRKQGYRIRTTWGRSVKITEDHSLFTRGDDGKPVPVFGKQLKTGDLVAVPARIPVIERRLDPFSIADKLMGTGLPLTVIHAALVDQVQAHETEIRNWLSAYGVSSRQHFRLVQGYSQSGRMPYVLWETLDSQTDVRLTVAGSTKGIKLTVENTEAFLWFLGFYLAEGCLVYRENQDYQLIFSSNLEYLDKLQSVVFELFGIDAPLIFEEGGMRAPSVRVRSRLIVELVVNAFGFGKALSTQKSIPDWVIQLPKNQLVHFLHGFWQGDGNHDAKTTGKQLIFNSSSLPIVEGLTLILARFGIIGSVTEFLTRVRREDDKTYRAYRLTVQGLDQYDLLDLEQTTQTLQAKATADLAWARVTAIEPFDIDEHVYDFSVPETENFVGGTFGICCHNTYGPRMHPNDGRVVSNFIVQALQNQPITVYGNGSQSRSFCYVDNMIDGFIRLMESPAGFTGPCNLGNPNEFTIRELAEKVIAMTGSKSEIIEKPLPSDDPTQRRPDITLARSKLGWEPEIQLEQGLVQTIAYFQQLLSEQ